MKTRFIHIFSVILLSSIFSCNKQEPDTSIDITFSRDSSLIVAPLMPITTTYKIVSATGEGKIELVGFNGIKQPVIFPTASDPMSGKIQFEMDREISMNAYAEFRISNSSREIFKRFTFEGESISPKEGIRKTVSTQGGTVSFDFLSNVDYIPQIPQDAKSWISVSSTKAITNRSVSFNVAANNGVAREAAITIKSKISSNSIVCRIAQDGIGNKLNFSINSYSFKTPLLYGNNISASIDWGDGNGIMMWGEDSKAIYSDGVEKHSVKLETINVGEVKFQSLTGLVSIDFTQF